MESQPKNVYLILGFIIVIIFLTVPLVSKTVTIPYFENVTVPYNVTVEKEIQIPYTETIETTTNVKLSEPLLLLDACHFAPLDEGKWYYFDFYLYRDQNISMTFHALRASAYILTSQQFQSLMPGEEPFDYIAKGESTKGVLNHTVLFDDYYYFVIQHDEQEQSVATIEEWGIEKFWTEEKIVYEDFIRYTTEIVFMTETRYREEYREVSRNETIKVTILKSILGS